MSTRRIITIRATRDFYAGARQANGTRDVAIHKGETRQIADPGPEGPFYTTSRWGTRFGLCRLGHGWVQVESSATIASRSRADSRGEKDTADALHAGQVKDGEALDEALVLPWLNVRTDQSEEDQDDEDFWPF